MRIIIRNDDEGFKIVSLNPEKYGPEYKEIMKDIVVERFDKKTNQTVKETVSVVDRVIKPYSAAKPLEGLSSDQWFLYDGEIDKSDLESRKQLYLDGDTIKKDMKWEKRLMPDQLIKYKEINSIKDKLKAETDAVKVAQLTAELEELKNIKAGPHNEEKLWSEKALAGLDRAETDKPEIRTKLQQKIQDLT